MSALTSLQSSMTAQGIDFDRSICIATVKVTFGVYDSNGIIKTALFIDWCNYCPMHGKKSIIENRIKRRANSILFYNNIIVIRAWECLAIKSPMQIIERLQFSLNRQRNLRTYCTVLNPRGVR